MAASDTKLTVGLDLTQSTPYFTFTDTTNMVDLGVSNIKGTLRITINGETSPYHYDNLNDFINPDIDRSNGTARSNTISVPIPLPLNSNDELVKGSYKIEYNSEYDGSGSADAENQITIDLEYNRVTGVLTSEVDLLPTNPTMSVTDATNYEVDLVTPTITRALSLVPPSLTSLPLSTSTTTATTLTISQFSTGEWYGELVGDVTYDFSSKTLTGATNNFTSGNFTLNVIDQVIKVLAIPVEGSAALCEIYCCLSEWEERLDSARTTNPTLYQRLVNKAGELSYYLSLTQQSYACSETSSVNHYVERIKEITECNEQCGCSDDTPVLITGVATSNAALGNKIKFTTTTNTASYQNLNLKGKDFDNTQADFLVWVDGIYDEGTFNANTYTYSFANTVPTGVEVVFVILK